MPVLSEEEIGTLLVPYVSLLFAAKPGATDFSRGEGELEAAVPGLIAKLSIYLDLLVRWNEKTNLTAIRTPAEMVTRHFGESLFAGLTLRELLKPGMTLLDFGSGAGFPGLPIQLLRPDLAVTLAESQSKKAAFLREAVRAMRLKTVIWARRVEEMAPGAQFDCVTMRAVDVPEVAYREAIRRLGPGGWLLSIGAGASGEASDRFHIPQSSSGYVQLMEKTEVESVPRGTLA